MNKAVIIGSLLGAIGITTTGTVAGYYYIHRRGKGQANSTATSCRLM